MGCTTSKAAKKPTNMKEDNSVKGKKSKGGKKELEEDQDSEPQEEMKSGEVREKLKNQAQGHTQGQTQSKIEIQQKEQPKAKKVGASSADASEFRSATTSNKPKAELSEKEFKTLPESKQTKKDDGIKQVSKLEEVEKGKPGSKLAEDKSPEPRKLTPEDHAALVSFVLDKVAAVTQYYMTLADALVAGNNEHLIEKSIEDLRVTQKEAQNCIDDLRKYPFADDAELIDQILQDNDIINTIYRDHARLKKGTIKQEQFTGKTLKLLDETGILPEDFGTLPPYSPITVEPQAQTVDSPAEKTVAGKKEVQTKESSAVNEKVQAKESLAVNEKQSTNDSKQVSPAQKSVKEKPMNEKLALESPVESPVQQKLSKSTKQEAPVKASAPEKSLKVAPQESSFEMPVIEDGFSTMEQNQVPIQEEQEDRLPVKKESDVALEKKATPRTSVKSRVSTNPKEQSDQKFNESQFQDFNGTAFGSQANSSAIEGRSNWNSPEKVLAASYNAEARLSVFDAGTSSPEMQASRGGRKGDSSYDNLMASRSSSPEDKSRKSARVSAKKTSEKPQPKVILEDPVRSSMMKERMEITQKLNKNFETFASQRIDKTPGSIHHSKIVQESPARKTQNKNPLAESAIIKQSLIMKNHVDKVIDQETEKIRATKYITERDQAKAELDQMLSDFKTMKEEFDTMGHQHNEYKSDYQKMESELNRLKGLHSQFSETSKAVITKHQVFQSQRLGLQDKYREIGSEQERIKMELFNLDSFMKRSVFLSPGSFSNVTNGTPGVNRSILTTPMTNINRNKENFQPIDVTSSVAITSSTLKSPEISKRLFASPDTAIATDDIVVNVLNNTRATLERSKRLRESSYNSNMIKA